MRLDPTIAFILMFLSLIAGAAAVSASWGYALGRNALQGITQPDVRPSSLKPTQTSGHHQELTILSETEIIEEVKARMGQGSDQSSGAEPGAASQLAIRASHQQASAPESHEKPVTTMASQTDTSPGGTFVSNGSAFVDYRAGFPRISENRGVILEVRSVEQQGDQWIASISVQNVGAQSVQFLSDSLNVVDNQGRLLVASLSGLPVDLLPTGEEYRGAISIPATLLYDSETLSLTLVDASRQGVELSVADIPVVR
ncbi:MAG: hypothetical protein VKK04_01485 [Synechococcales bacterium]|nr:hypothetical protein [Synechococcales bacterium]